MAQYSPSKDVEVGDLVWVSIWLPKRNGEEPDSYTTFVQAEVIGERRDLGIVELVLCASDRTCFWIDRNKVFLKRISI